MEHNQFLHDSRYVCLFASFPKYLPVRAVIAFDIYITQSNSLGLPKGARILVGVATASAMSQ